MSSAADHQGTQSHSMPIGLLCDAIQSPGSYIQVETKMVTREDRLWQEAGEARLKSQLSHETIAMEEATVRTILKGVLQKREHFFGT